MKFKDAQITVGELVISANNNICTLFSSSHPAKERSLGWGAVPLHANGRGEDGTGIPTCFLGIMGGSEEAMGGTPFLIHVRDLVTLGCCARAQSWTGASGMGLVQG